MAPRCVLVGPPGAGKTTVGRAVAERLGVGFRDTDEDVAAAAGKPVSEIFVDDGEQAFRDLETVAVRRALREHDGVLALGGGAVLDAVTRAELAGRTVVALAVALHDATKRVGWGPGRPLLIDNPRATLGRLMRERAPLYREVAGTEVDTTGRSVDEVVEAVLAALHEDAARR